MSTDDRLVHCSKARSPIDVTESPMSTDDRFVHCSKAPSPINVTESNVNRRQARALVEGTIADRRDGVGDDYSPKDIRGIEADTVNALVADQRNDRCNKESTREGPGFP
jgi:hypothetical protein